MNYGYGPQEMDTAQDLVVRACRRAEPPIYDSYAHNDTDSLFIGRILETRLDFDSSR